MEIAIHCHDDFGMATANTVEAVRAGADLVDVTVIRTGHRCGNASLEQVVAALESIYGVDTGVKLEQLRPLCQFVAEEYGLTIPANAPVVGDSMYTYGGIHGPAPTRSSPRSGRCSWRLPRTSWSRSSRGFTSWSSTRTRPA
jgi:isopropylmalate/homocitrate/citramalate synthase